MDWYSFHDVHELEVTVLDLCCQTQNRLQTVCVCARVREYAALCEAMQLHDVTRMSRDQE